MDILDFDDIAAGLSKAADDICQIHFLGTIPDAEDYGEDYDTCFALTATEFSDTISWVGRHAQSFEDTTIPRILFVDPSGTLLSDPQSYAVDFGDYASLLAKFENSNTQLLDTGW